MTNFCNAIGFCGSPCGKLQGHLDQHRCGICGLEWKQRELLECGHPKDCLIHGEMPSFHPEGTTIDTEYCSACAERQQVTRLDEGSQEK